VRRSSSSDETSRKNSNFIRTSRARARDAVRVRAVDERTTARDARARRDARETVAKDGERGARTSTWARKRNDGARD